VLNVNVASSTGSPLANNVLVGCTCTESNFGNNTGTDSITVSQMMNITLATASPTGLQVSADGGVHYFTAPHVFQLVPGPAMIVTQSPQSGGAGTQYGWVSWSDSGAISHTITVGGAPATCTATLPNNVPGTGRALPQTRRRLRQVRAGSECSSSDLLARFGGSRHRSR
jgi:hypothetical protein